VKELLPRRLLVWVRLTEQNTTEFSIPKCAGCWLGLRQFIHVAIQQTPWKTVVHWVVVEIPRHARAVLRIAGVPRLHWYEDARAVIFQMLACGNCAKHQIGFFMRIKTVSAKIRNNNFHFVFKRQNAAEIFNGVRPRPPIAVEIHEADFQWFFHSFPRAINSLTVDALRSFSDRMGLVVVHLYPISGSSQRIVRSPSG